MKKIAIVALITLLAFSMLSMHRIEIADTGIASPDPGWAKSYGGTDFDGAMIVEPIYEGYLGERGYVIAGDTYSFGVDQRDIWILKLEADGTMNANTWQRRYGLGDFEEDALSIQEVSDGYIVAGDWFYFGDLNALVLKLDANGGIVWYYEYGQAWGWDEAHCIQQTTDGGYIVAGYTDSFGAGQRDFWVLKLYGDGEPQWSYTYGGVGWDEAKYIRETTDGGYIVAGFTASFGAGGKDVWVLKLDANGGVMWGWTYGGTGWDEALCIRQTTDGGYIVAGYTESFGFGSSDVWILKLYPDGMIDWQRTYGGQAGDVSYSICQTLDGGYVVGGFTMSFGLGSTDAWVLKLDANGGIDWQRTYGGTYHDYSSSIRPTTDGGYIVGGWTESFGAGFGDVWVLKLDIDGNAPSCIMGESQSNFTEPNIVWLERIVDPIMIDVRIEPLYVPAHATDAQIEDLCPSTPITPILQHNVAIKYVDARHIELYPGWNIEVTISNVGDYEETANVTVYLDDTVIGHYIPILPPETDDGIEAKIPFEPDIELYVNYTLRVEVSPVPGETILSDNLCKCGYFLIKMIGDVNGDKTVDIFDVVLMAKAFGSEPGDPRWDPTTDINSDNIVDIFDIVLVAKEFGKTYTPEVIT